MTAGRWQVVNDAREGIIGNTIDITAGSYYAVLTTELHTPSNVTDTTLGSLTNECLDADYARLDLTGVLATETAGIVTVDANDIDFGAAVTISAKYCYIVQGTVLGSAPADLVLCWVDLSAEDANPVSSVAGPFSILLNALGLFQLSQGLPAPVTAVGTVVDGLIGGIGPNSEAVSVTITNSGAGYTGTPNCTFSAGSITQATGVCVMAGDVVSSITITLAGEYAPGDLPITVIIDAP